MHGETIKYRGQLRSGEQFVVTKITSSLDVQGQEMKFRDSAPRVQKTFPKSLNDDKILGGRKVTCGKYHAQDQLILSGTLLNLVTTATRRPGLYTSTLYQREEIPVPLK